jgi:hypothetical protein
MAMPEARRIAALEQGRVPNLARFLKMPDESLLHHLVEVRGRLHHHAMTHHRGAWHPDKHRAFQAEAEFLAGLANAVAQNQNMPILFDDELNEKIRAATARENVAYTFVVEVQEDDRQAVELYLTLPTLAPSHAALVTLEEEIRKEHGPLNRRVIRSYRISSSDKSEIFARYQNNTLSTS